MFKDHKPIRMCVICRVRLEKSELSKFAVKKESGRSFYICNTCINQKDKNNKKRLSKFLNSINFDDDDLKEKLLNGEC
ncbi:MULTISPECIES: hypothetical protein [unclassified Campylobacter]|uniref:hypothetical protein n=1 Tax=unclassified Campylobacter TaxID=2593542 RepID=UPI0022E9E533|nr:MULTISPECIES: hypothetical protein [unclassified Campylobacter]MDA3055482.1 hypothetical protein [Campylobacter sp. CN_NA1]MDA3064828.1 hypothetical protein [Campylobacter sp. CN_NE4]MDA3068348.1 hypothetical protein [Campylobacter sp. CN_NE3]MDA3082339.1 hypothetical protein [Campylobacter sp. CN_EL2]MDA3083974.1 hypothetical protein [Campylobacter sp. CN_NE1]